MHVAQKCAAVLGQRHASKQKLKARRLNPLQRDALYVGRSSVLAPKVLFRYSQGAKVNVMDTRTLLILGLGIVILLLLGFFALPA
ncbi:hypothetical protein [Mesorhizobium captivum]|uniref:hypothetical protein n=1 Tax=Mesorhizobium captivum TaxID=3072319 RepID=UPI002A24B16B|nr:MULTISPECIES: hypothetical protein [unclassified Mesorhizobium]MDX8497423.1 hypothetical protein [Mesorhizobium sp. VK4C]MDX8513459.1 hypothetical protein [Mesorhizobium sp. VK23E]